MTTVSGALDGMSRMLTRGDGFAVDDFGSVGGARHGELAPRQRLTRARHARPKLVVAEHPVEGSVQAAGSSGGMSSPVSPGCTSSALPPGADAITGTPSDIASSSDCDKPSIRDGRAAIVAKR